MRVTCFAEDLEMLQGLEALETGFYDSDEIKDATQDHAKYLAERLTIRNVDGELLKPKISEVVDVHIPDGGIPAGSLMQHQLTFVFDYKYDKAPEFITIQQNMVAEGALLPSEFRVLLKQSGSDRPFAKMLKPLEPATFRFDWDSPALNDDDSEEDWEKWFEEQREKTLGISSYGSVYSFIYITDYQVRHEILIPLATLATLIDIERKDESFLEIDEQPAAAKKVETFFGSGNPVTIDGIEVKPVFDRVDFYGLNLSDFAVRPEKRKVSMASGRVGVILSYSVKNRPTEISVEWNLLSHTIREVDSVVIAYQEVAKTRFSKFLSENVYRWKAPDRPPLPPITELSGTIDREKYQPKKITISWATIGLGGIAVLAFGLFFVNSRPATPYLAVAMAGAVGSYFVSDFAVATYDHPLQQPEQFDIAADEAADIFGRLHANIFRAFDYVDESDVYQALSKSVDGELLRDLYLKINQSLRVQEQGGAVAVIEKVCLIDGNPLPTPDGEQRSPIRFGYFATWTLDGTIEHWGHIHEKTNQYRARFVVELLEADDGSTGWKITDIQDHEFEPGVIRRRLRKF